ncbi:uncharacterized protein IWZ02DRAFT_203200 [Phyllosticta citriasiana]|uniref:Uncharacterized protein n=1 Tax=Phyllosticta citriasiana TaxID=595635 RepID=A0ABR1KNI1_9PEZI
MRKTRLHQSCLFFFMRNGLKYRCCRRRRCRRQPQPGMCKTYRWTCNACGRSQSRGQRCSNRLDTTVNCPNNTRVDGLPPQAEHSGIRCAYCHTPTPKSDPQIVNPAPFASNTQWEARHDNLSPSLSWNSQGHHQAAFTDYQSPTRVPTLMRSHRAMTTTPDPAVQLHHCSSRPGNAHQVLPTGQHLHYTPGSLPHLAQHHRHGNFASPTSSAMPIDPQLLPHQNHFQHAARPTSHASAAAKAPTQQYPSPDQARHPHEHASPTTNKAPVAPGGGEATSESAPHLRSTTDMLSSMTATRTALFAHAEARRVANENARRGREDGQGSATSTDAEKQRPDVGGDEEVDAAWYALWEGCGVPRAVVSAARAAATTERTVREKGNENGEGNGDLEGGGAGRK